MNPGINFASTPLEALQQFMVAQDAELSNGEDLSTLREIKALTFTEFMQRVRQEENLAFELTHDEVSSMQRAKMIWKELGAITRKGPG